MRRSTLLKQTSSNQSICAFCACRLSGDTVATRASSSINYIQRRQSSGGLTHSQSSIASSRTPVQNGGVGASHSGPVSSGQIGRQSAFSTFPDAASEARATLDAMNRQKKAEQDALIRSKEEASERHASQKLFGAQPSQNGQPKNDTPTQRRNRSQDQEPQTQFRMNRTLPGAHNTISGVQTAGRRDNERRQNNRSDQKSSARDRPSQRSNHNRIMPDVQGQNSIRFMPSLDTSKQKPAPKVQAPSWMTSQQRDPPAVSSPKWGISPAPLNGREVDSTPATPTTLSEPVKNRDSVSNTPGSVASEGNASSGIFGQVDATRQALAKSQDTRRLDPLRNAMSALKRVQSIRGADDNRGGNVSTSRTSTARSETTPSETSPRSLLGDQSETVTYSPFGADSLPARSALAKQTDTVTREVQTEQRYDREQKQRYKITMSDSSKRDESAPPFDPEISSNWSILNRKQQQPQVSEPQEELVAESRTPFRTPDDIDAKFQEYRRRRPSNGIDLENIAYMTREAPQSRRTRNAESRSCARCGEQGHIAVNCTKFSANVPVCFGCGVKGHVMRDCPEANQGRPKYGSSRRVDVSQQSTNQATDTRSEGKFRIRRVVEGVEPVEPFKKQEAEEEDDDDDMSVARRGGKPRKLAEEPAEAVEKPIRRGRRGEDGEIGTERPNRSVRRTRVRDDDEEDVRPSRGRRSRNDEDDEAELSYADFEGAREKRMERKKARQAKKDKAAKEAAKSAARQARKEEEQTQIRLPEFISVSNLAQTLGVRYENFVRKMEELGFTSHSHDHVLTAETASLIAMEYNFDPIVGDVNNVEVDERDLKARPDIADKEFLPTRPPVVAIMGHVDHGKTTILDFLRKSSIAAGEHGGITQHIGAFSVGLSSGKTITFLDTPGHAAFLEMRKRGATVTDIIILVVAADDSVKPQTIEAIKHAKAANVPIIVAINKIDKEEANIDRVKQDLARHEVEIEDFGGDTQVVPVSGKTGTGIDDLEDNIVTLSEILDHRAETDGPVEGWVLEGTTKKAGRVATVLVRRGTLVPGNILVAGKTWTRVRTLKNEAGVNIHSAGPGTPVEVDGWREQPTAGDEALQAPNEQKAADVVDYRLELEERTKMAEDMEAINETRRAEAEKRERERVAAEAAAKAAKAAAIALDDGTAVEPAAAEKTVKEEELNVTPGHQTVPFIIKADVSGSVEAVSAYLLQMSNPLCSPTLLRAGVGPVSEFDIEHADAAGGHIISFNLPHAPEMIGQADKRGVKLIEENVIYRIVGDVKAVLEEKLPPIKSQRVVGEADVAMSFEIGVGGRKKLRIAGCKIRNGMIGRGSRVRVLRGERKVYDGVLSSLKNVKKDVQEMRKGTECGMGFDGWEEFEVGDQIQTYEEKVEKRTLQI